MSRTRKLLERLDSIPKDMTWDELRTLLLRLGFTESQGSGSRVAFHVPDEPSRTIRLHQPHNRNPPHVLAPYLRAVKAHLVEWGYYDDVD